MAKSYYNDTDFLNMFFGAVCGAGLGMTLGFCSLPFLKPIVSAILSNLPLVPHLVFLPTFTGPFIVASLAIGCGIAGGWMLLNLDDNDHPSYSSGSPRNNNNNYDNKREFERSSPTYSPRKEKTVTFVVPSAQSEPQDQLGYTPSYVSSSSNNRYCSSSFSPVQQKAEVRNSASASLQTVSFGSSDFGSNNNNNTSNFSPVQQKAEARNSASASLQTVSFGSSDFGSNNNNNTSSFNPQQSRAETSSSVSATNNRPSFGSSDF